MAGVTNRAYRRLCREFGSPDAIYVRDDHRARHRRAQREDAAHDGLRRRRVAALHAALRCRPANLGEAVRIVAGEGWADHIDLNLGCPVPKVTKLGGGAAPPYKRGLLARIVDAMVSAAAPYGVPVTLKFRKASTTST